MRIPFLHSRSSIQVRMSCISSAVGLMHKQVGQSLGIPIDNFLLGWLSVAETDRRRSRDRVVGGRRA